MLILSAETWKPFGRGYEVSDAGRVRNASRRLLKPWAHRSGHLYVSLGRGNRWQMHRLVLSAFGVVGKPGQEVRHLDGDPTNNHLGNLAWGTRAENIADLKRHSGMYARQSVSDETAAAIRSAFTGRHGEQTRIAREFGVNLNLVHDIVRGKSYVVAGR